MPESLQKNISSYFNLFLFIGIAINLPALFTPVMDQDSALYATVAKNIIINNDWVNLIANGTDWLDKPHLPFWLTALSFKIFGISAFAYKLPSLLCWLLGVYYIYKLAQALYDKATAQLATIIFISLLHVILSNYDVRAEGYLTTFIAASIYHLYRLYKTNEWKQVFIAAFFCACAVMTKGIFVLMTVAAGFVMHWLFTKQWKQFANIKWYAMALLSLLFIMPELYCLYVQFDLHPEKTVWGVQNMSGIKFFFWDSQFGRFFNTGPIKGKGDPSFFFHTTAWAFLPWTIVLLAALYSLIKTARKNITSEKVIITGSALLTFFVFSISQFQLPHYIVILFPHFSMLSAAWLINNADEKIMKRLNVSALITTIIILILVFAVGYYYDSLKLQSLLITFLLLEISNRINKQKKQNENLFSKYLSTNFFIAVLISIFINLFFYKELMNYAGGMNAAQWQNENKNISSSIMLDCNNWLYEFYAKSKVIHKASLSQNDFGANDSLIVFGPLTSIQKIDNQKIETTILKQVDYFRITKLNAKFINYKTRPGQLEQYAIAVCKPKP